MLHAIPDVAGEDLLAVGLRSPRRIEYLRQSGGNQKKASARLNPDFSNCRVHRGDESAKLVLQSKA
jgi:hypothetical protein